MTVWLVRGRAHAYTNDSQDQNRQAAFLGPARGLSDGLAREWGQASR